MRAFRRFQIHQAESRIVGGRVKRFWGGGCGILPPVGEGSDHRGSGRLSDHERTSCQTYRENRRIRTAGQTVDESKSKPDKEFDSPGPKPSSSASTRASRLPHGTAPRSGTSRSTRGMPSNTKSAGWALTERLWLLIARQRAMYCAHPEAERTMHVVHPSQELHQALPVPRGHDIENRRCDLSQVTAAKPVHQLDQGELHTPWSLDLCHLPC